MVASCYRSHGSVGALDPAGASWKACPCGVLVTQGAGRGHLHLAQPGCQGVQGQAGECCASRPPAGALPQDLQAALLQVGVVQ